jgi:hypothetical protein
MKQTFSNRVYNGTSKQTAAAGDNFYITAIVGVVDGNMGSPALATISFDDLTNLSLMDDKVVTFPFPIRTQDFTPNSQNVTVVYYEGQ